MTARRLSVSGFERRLGHRFADPGLLRRALTHSSERTGVGRDYQRLEFLGDRVLGLVIAEHLLERFPGEREGALARRHVTLVRREALAGVARRVGLGDSLILGYASTDPQLRDRDRILADTMEAIIAAIYLDGGLAAAAKVILRHWTPLAAANAGAMPPHDSKSALQQWALGQKLPLPSYATVSRAGSEHEPEFEISVEVAGLAPRTARGRTKRQAEQAAAAALLADIRAG